MKIRPVTRSDRDACARRREAPYDPPVTETDDRLEFRQARSRVKTTSLWPVREPPHTRSSGHWKNYRPTIEDVEALNERG